MNYPNQQYPAQPQQQYPPQFPQAPAPQYPQAPGGYPQQPYAQPQYPAQQYPPQAQQQPAAPPLATGTLDDYYSQPSAASGPSLSWANAAPGTTVVGIVARDVTNSDIQQQTNPQGIPQTFRDGRPKYVMKVPLKVPASQSHPEGEATWYVKGQARDELVRAMAEAGATEKAPKAGAQVAVTLVGKRPSGAGYNPSNVFQVVYTPSGGGAGAQAPAPQQPAQQYQQQAPDQGQQYQQPVQQAAPQGQAPAYQPSVDQTIQQQGATGQPAPAWAQDQQQPQGQAPAQAQAQPQFQQPSQGQPGQQLQAPPDFNSEQAALLARISGQNAQPGGAPAA
ncbi:hypothetical protein ABKW28_12950 [Nocardioides sp. 31GB23]|uniref:hypothetical protein n=1 Tax=Nocardioides sp. 31GB23 TaxID=3156065 RepID=UPI0032AFDB4F